MHKKYNERFWIILASVIIFIIDCITIRHLYLIVLHDYHRGDCDWVYCNPDHFAITGVQIFSLSIGISALLITFIWTLAKLQSLFYKNH